MRQKHNRFRIVLGYAGFFAIVAVTVTVAMLIYAGVANKSAKTVALVMLVAILVLSALCLFVEILRRRFTVDAPVSQILDATERIAKGDFTVRLAPKHSFKHYNEFDRIMENLNRMAMELSRNEVLKTDFISNVSHEIKTPLSVIQNYAAALQNDKTTDAERKKYTETLIGAAKRLTNLVTNILQLNKLENQQIRPESVCVRLDELLAQSIFGLEEIIEQKKLSVRCDVDEVEAVTVPSYLEIVWNNLLSNAVKFTPEGGEIGVTLKAEGGDVVVRFSDTGCGISPETGAHIFEKFYQGDTSHAKDGNGLGLALVKKVIDILGGDIFVESEPGKGSTFTVVLKGAVREKRE